MGVTRLDDGRTAEDAPGGAVLLSGFSYLIGELFGSPGRALDSIMLFTNSHSTMPHVGGRSQRSNMPALKHLGTAGAAQGNEAMASSNFPCVQRRRCLPGPSHSSST